MKFSTRAPGETSLCVGSGRTGNRRDSGRWRTPENLRAKIVVCACLLLFSASGGAGTIRQVVDSKPALCKQFVAILEAANVRNMTDAQLCKFHFDQLPASITKGITFPRWTRLKVGDPLAMYKKMVLANWRADWAQSATPQQFFVNYVEGLYQAYQLIVRASHERAVDFYTAMLPASEWSGDVGQPQAVKRLPESFHLVQMRIDFCRDQKLRSGLYYAVSYQPDLTNPFDAVGLEGSTIALWRGNLLLIDAGPTWWSGHNEAGPSSVDARVNLASWYPAGYSNVYQQPFRAGFDPGPTVCWYSIEK
ncbi:MAG TPA: hypothetical protein VFJ87_13160 [Rhodanobacteraceae bacterium]|nr:hypothetical protein [Rhodanobacteraceae bacterium]